ncbi:gamma-glutamyl-gamma-aminobutyraldehyde dehydrogenase [Enterobacter cloacae]|uniref:Gamma-glutamyl-gamma-aminobutyraldehyde dehydrogenase n=1 Tax=Enterobacter cloacae TaxID=550 RepID=A0A377M1C4_ENTCL|nr:gamma-glutamyl-gamma-aminobutyraldehyde dehydrogenase [Enterobacter cloacae]
MHFQHLTYWQDKAKNSAIETRLFINGAYCDAADNATFETVNPATQQTLANVARGKQRTWTVQFRRRVRYLSAVTGRRRLRRSARPCSISLPI